METAIGRTIDSYKIVDFLGKGGMGIVYKALDTTLDREVALKMMDARIGSEPNFLRRFQSEAKALAKLQNPNIVSIFAMRETELGLCIVMEYVKGRTLADLLRQKGALPIPRVLSIFKQILNALGHAHKAGVIHRDIKPSNVLLTDDDFVKVTDFGLAKIQQTSAVTVTMGTGGTLYYMSPEQLRGLANVDHRGDIYSTGMTLYESLTGRIPFQDPEADFNIRQAIVDGKIDPPDKMKPSLPKEIVKVVMKAIAKDPDKRYQSTTEMWSALEHLEVASQFVAKAAADAQTMLVPSLSRERPKKKWPLYTGIGAGVLLIAVILLRSVVFPSATLLTVKTDPAGSTVVVNGKTIGDSPVMSYQVSPGKISVQVRKQGYVPRDTVLRIEDGDEMTLDLPLRKRMEVAEKQHLDDTTLQKEESTTLKEEPTTRKEEPTTRKGDTTPKSEARAKLTLRVVPIGTVKVDGSTVTHTGNTAVSVPLDAGTRSVRFESPGYESKSMFVTLKPGETRELTCYYESYVNLQALPTWGTIVLDGRRTDMVTPYDHLALKPGTHSITVTRAGFETAEGSQSLVIQPVVAAQPKVYRLVFHLTKK
jgi:serine/threonine protein kinase